MKIFYRLITILFATMFLSVPAFADDTSSLTTTSLPTQQSVSPSSQVTKQVNINTADAQTIAAAGLKGIADKRAQAIVAYRDQHGPFKSIDDLTNVKGLSQSVINENRDKITLN